MHFTTLLIQAVALSTASASIVARQRDCQALYNDCLAAGRPTVACQCDLATCSGEDNARTREYCASATANLTKPIATPTSSSASIIVGTPGSQPSGQAPVTAAEGSLALGQTCSDSRQCANGAQCYGTTAFTIRTCGSFNAACDSNAQCATNTCQNGICSGFLATSSSTSTKPSSTVSVITGTAGSQPSGQPPITAPEGSLALGDNCSDSRQCANGAQCFGSTAFTIRTCGNFNAACSKDSQCAFNTCNNGLCNGFITSSSSSAAPTKTTSTASIIVGTPGSQPSGQAPVTAAEGSLKLGEICSDSRQCATVAGKAVDCFGSTAFTIRRCGNYNGLCEIDAQCAYNTCNGKLCNGLILTSSAAPVPTTMATSAKACKIKTVYID